MTNNDFPDHYQVTRSNDNDASLSENDIQQLLEAGAPILPGPSLLASMKQKILSRISTPPEDLKKSGVNPGWQMLTEHIDIKFLHRDENQGTQHTLWRCRPGATIAAHRHTRDEELLVIEGDLRCGERLMQAGDFEIMAADSFHPALYTEAGCLLYLRGEIFELSGY